jgi:hypothetical protein
MAEHPAHQANIEYTTIKLGSVTLEDAAHLALGKAINYAVSSAVLPIHNVLTCIEKAVVSLSKQAVV